MACTAATTAFLLHRFPSHHYKYFLNNLAFPRTLTTPSSPFLGSRLASPSAVPPPPRRSLHLHAATSAFTGGSGEGQSAAPRAVAEQDLSRLFVGNLPFSMTAAELKEVFEQAGPVVAVDIIYDRVTARSRGFAFVTMAGPEEAQKAIGMFDGAQVGGRTVKVNLPEVPRGGEREAMGPKTYGIPKDFVDTPYKVYAGNLGWSVTSESLGKAFAGLPGMLSARVVYDRETGRSRGFGFISFGSTEDAYSAVESMNGVEVEGRPLRLSLSTATATASGFSRSASSGS